MLMSAHLLLAVSFPSWEDTTASETEPAAEGLSQSRQSYCEELEEKLAAALEKVEGVGRTSVMITLKSDGKKLVEKDAERTESREERGQEESGSSLANVQERNSTVYEKNGQGGENQFSPVMPAKIPGIEDRRLRQAGERQKPGSRKRRGAPDHTIAPGRHRRSVRENRYPPRLF